MAVVPPLLLHLERLWPCCVASSSTSFVVRFLLGVCIIDAVLAEQHGRLFVYVVPYEVNVTDVNVTQSIFFELVFMLCHMM